jgi:hypothetical protein
MKIFGSRTAAMLASVAALSMTAAPAMAQGWGGNGGRGHHRDHDDTGWIVGGIIGIGMIAAIASAASKRDRDARERDYRYPDGDYRSDGYRSDGYRGEDYRYGNRSGEASRQTYSGSARGIDAAVDSCVSEVERGSTRVDTVDSVDRDGSGWRVTGRIGGGRSFDCAVDADGRINSVSVDGRSIG